VLVLVLELEPLRQRYGGNARPQQRFGRQVPALGRRKRRPSKTPEALSRTRYWSEIEPLDQFGEHSMAKRLCHWAA
jgi:hypothetical protein